MQQCAIQLCFELQKPTDAKEEVVLLKEVKAVEGGHFADQVAAGIGFVLLVALMFVCVATGFYVRCRNYRNSIPIIMPMNPVSFKPNYEPELPSTHFQCTQLLKFVLEDTFEIPPHLTIPSWLQR